MCACLLAWLGWVESASEGLHLCCDRRGGQVEALTTPSQRRYVQYFSRLLDCEPLKREALLLRSVHLEELPREGASSAVQVDVFNCGTLVFATRVALAGARSVDIVCGRVIRVGGGVGREMQGNIVVRVREVCADGSRRSVCRCMVHTGYVSGTVRLQKEQLDGACNDPRWGLRAGVKVGAATRCVWSCAWRRRRRSTSRTRRATGWRCTRVCCWTRPRRCGASCCTARSAAMRVPVHLQLQLQLQLPLPVGRRGRQRRATQCSTSTRRRRSRCP